METEDRGSVYDEVIREGFCGPYTEDELAIKAHERAEEQRKRDERRIAEGKAPRQLPPYYEYEKYDRNVSFHQLPGIYARDGEHKKPRDWPAHRPNPRNTGGVHSHKPEPCPLGLVGVQTDSSRLYGFADAADEYYASEYLRLATDRVLRAVSNFPPSFQGVV